MVERKIVMCQREGGEEDLETRGYKLRRRLTNIPSQNVFDLFLLETTFDDEAACAVYAACGTHFGKQELDDMFRLRHIYAK